MRLWLIDDTPDQHLVAARTASLVAGVDFSGFPSASDGVAAYIQAEQAGEPPDVILMDYFLGDDRGDRVTAQLRQLEAAKHSPVIIGYSSVASGSQRIVAAGGNLILRKHATSEGINPTLLRWLRARQ